MNSLRLWRKFQAIAQHLQPLLQQQLHNMHHEPWIHTKNLMSKFPHFFDMKKVLEVGSLNINGSVREFFTNCDYLGIDLGEGPGVDLVCPIHELPLGNYDVVISTEMLEHDIHWEKSLKSMFEQLKPGGLWILTCAGPTRQEHGTKRTTPGDAPFTTDYYRNISIEDFKSVINESDFTEFDLHYERGMADLIFYGIKK